ncbi:MAG: hypothetical protein ACI93E_000523 [Flavobacteriales bacterium]|jgi:hypothetical protein
METYMATYTDEVIRGFFPHNRCCLWSLFWGDKHTPPTSSEIGKSASLQVNIPVKEHVRTHPVFDELILRKIAPRPYFGRGNA